MDELTLDNKKYLSSKQAAKVTGYAKDYVGQLCREGRIDARLVGRNWYVLESSILEHRFGADDKKDEEIKPEITPQDAWETPRYIAEEAPIVPELAPKPKEVGPLPTLNTSTEGRAHLADMQSAWQEWFQTQGNKAENVLPDASEMLLEDHEEPSPVIEEEREAVEESEIEEYEPEEEVEPIHIARIRPEPVPTRRMVTETMGEPLRLVRHEEDEQEAYEEMPKMRRGRHIDTVKTPRKGNLVLNAILLSVAGLAVAVTTLGSGAIDELVTVSGWSNPVTNFISGINVVDINR